MQTEIDTLRKLRQTPFNELLAILGNRLLEESETLSPTLEEHYWQYEEFRIRLNDLLKPIVNIEKL